MADWLGGWLAGWRVGFFCPQAAWGSAGPAGTAHLNTSTAQAQHDPAPFAPPRRRYKLPIESRRAYMSRLLVRKDGSFHDQLMQARCRGGLG